MAEAMAQRSPCRSQVEKRKIDEALGETRRALKRLKAAQAREKSARARVWQLTPPLRRAVLTIYVLADGVLEPAVAYLRACAKMRHWDERQDDELAEVVLCAFLETDVAELADLVCLDPPADLASAVTAVRCVTEWRVVQWVKCQNSQQRVAPSTGLVLQKYEEQRQSCPETVRPPFRGTAAHRVGREWVRRLRKRFGGTYGKLRVRDEPPQSELRGKAARMEWLENLPTLPCHCALSPLRRRLTQPSDTYRKGVGIARFWIVRTALRLASRPKAVQDLARARRYSSVPP